MIDELFFIGAPYEFQKKTLVYPPLVKDVILQRDYGLYVKILTLSQEEIEDDFIEAGKTMEVYPTPLEFLLNNSYHDANYENLVKESFRFFTHSEIVFLYDQKAIAFGKLEELLNSLDDLQDLSLLTEENFLNFQNAIRHSIGAKEQKAPDPNEHPKIKEMKRKARYRDKVKAKEAKGISLFTILASICCMGLNLNPLNIGEISYAALVTLFQKYQDKEKYSIDIQSLLSGADPKKVKPENWIKNFDK